jgi:hypothetical protein
MVSAFIEMPLHHAPKTGFLVYTGITIAVTGGLLIWWAVSERRRGPAFLLILLGGLIAGFSEAWLDNVVLVWWPPDQDLVAFHAMGRAVPLFVPIGYSWFCGGLLYFTARFYQRGVTVRQVWAILGAIVVVDFIGIGVPTWLGLMGFYGHPPMNILGYPLWWAAIDGVDVILGGAVVFFLLPVLKGRQLRWLVLVPPVMIGLSAGAVGWPVSTAINSGWSTGGKWAAAAVTTGFGMAIVHLVAQVVSRQSSVEALSGVMRSEIDDTQRNTQLPNGNLSSSLSDLTKS